MASPWAHAQRSIQPRTRTHDCAAWGDPLPQRRSGWSGRACVAEHRPVQFGFRKLGRSRTRPPRASKPALAVPPTVAAKAKRARERELHRSRVAGRVRFAAAKREAAELIAQYENSGVFKKAS